MKCTRLFCNDDAAALVTIPHYAPRTPTCQTHIDEWLRSEEVAYYRKWLGRVLVERIDPLEGKRT